MDYSGKTKEELIAELQNVNFLLIERRKELTCLHRISEILHKSELSDDASIRRIVEILPDAFQFPELAQAAITIEDKSWKTKGFKKTKNALSKDISLNNNVAGRVEICYPVKKLPDCESLFLPEEGELLYSVATRIGNFIVKYRDAMLLQESEVRYKSLVENLNEIIYEHDRNGILTYVSPRFETIIGYATEELLGKPVWQILGIEKQIIIDLITNVREKNDLHHDLKYYTRKGEERWMSISSRAVIKDGKFLGAKGSLEDITEQKSLQLKLEKSEETFRKMVERVNDVVYEIGIDGTVVYVSPAIEKVLGYKPDEIEGKNFFAFMYPADIPVIMDAMKHLAERDSSFLEYRYYNKNSELRWVRSSTAPVIRDGKLAGGIGVLTDINRQKLVELALKESEAQLQNLINSQTNYVLRTDLQGKHVYWNPKFEEVFGWIYEKTGIRGCDSMISICSYHHQRTIDVVNKCFAEPGKVFKVELDKPSKDGSVRTTLWEFVALTNEMYEPVGIQCNGIDITDLKKAEDELKRNEEKYKALFYDSPEAFLIFIDGVFVECNIASEKLIGGNRSDIVGKTPPEISPEYQPNGKRSEIYVNEVVEQAISSGRNSFEWIHKRVDGSEFLAHINLSHIVYDGRQALFVTWSDITGIRKTEELNRKLSQAVEQSPVSVVITDIDGNIEYANPNACRTTGYELSELIGKNPRVLQSGETPLGDYTKLWSTIGSGNVWHGIFHNKKKTGELYWESSSIAPITDNSGKITHYVAVKEDITERKRIQEELTVNEARHRQVAQHGRTVIWEVDLNGLYTYLSDVAEQVYGYKPEELVNSKHFYDLHPAGMKEEFKKAGMQLVRSGQEVVNFDNPIETKDGRIVWVTTNGTPIYQGEVLTGFRGSDTDITERKLAEEETRKFRTILDQSNYGAAINDLEGNFLYLNKAFANMHGYEPEELIGRNIRIFHTEEQYAAVGSLISQMFEGNDLNSEEVWHVRRDGTVFPALMNATLISDKSGKPLFLSASALDITDMKMAEAALKKSEENLNHAQALAKMGSWDFDLLSGEVHWSRNYYNLVGIDPAEPPLSLDKIKKRIHPDDRNLFESKIASIVKDPTFETFDFRFMMDDGTLKWIQADILSKYENGKLTGITGISIDVTERKLADIEIRKLSMAVAQSPVQVVITDLDGNIEYINEAFTNITGY